MIRDLKTYYIIYVLLGTSEARPISSKYLSDYLSMSNKTIQTTILGLKDYCNDNGFEIIAKAGYGFYIRVTEEKKMKELYHALNLFFSNTYIIGNKDDILIANFILYLLQRETPISLAGLEDTFFLSQSTVYAYLNKTKEYLSESKIELINDKKKGIYTNGDEFIKRMFIANCLSSNLFQYDLTVLFGKDFYFLRRGTEQMAVMLRTLREYGLWMDDENCNIFSVYLSYAEFRYRQGHRLRELLIEKEELEERKELKIVKQLIRQLHLSLGEDQREIAAIAAFLLTFNDAKTEAFPERYEEGIQDLENYLDQFMKKQAPQLQGITIYRDSIRKLSVRYFFLNEFGLLDCGLSTLRYNFTQIPNAVSRYIGRLLMKQIKRYFGCSVNHRFAAYACLFAQNLIYMAEQEVKDMKLLLILKDGQMFSDYVVRMLKALLKPTPVKMDCVSLMEAEIMELDEYDLILSDYEYLNHVQSHYEVYRLDNPLERNVSFINEYYRSSRQINVTIENIMEQFSYIKVYENCRLESTQSFLNQVDADLDGRGEIPFHEVSRLGSPINYYGGKRTLIVPYLYRPEEEEHENILTIYFNEEGLHLKYNTMVFFSHSSDFGLKSLRQLADMCNEFYSNPAVFQKIIHALRKKS